MLRLNPLMPKSNFSEQIYMELLIKNFFYSESQNYMDIPTKFLLRPHCLSQSTRHHDCCQ